MSSNPADKKTKLSKHVLEMKFMQRGAIRDEQEKMKSDSQRAIDDEHWVLDLPNKDQSSCQFVVEPSFAICENLIFGRRSFKGFNADIEKLCKVLDGSQELQQAEEREQEMSVNDEEMTERYSSLVGTIAKKFAKKRQKSEVSANDDDRDSTRVSANDDDHDSTHATINTDNSASPATKKLKSKKFLKPKD